MPTHRLLSTAALATLVFSACASPQVSMEPSSSVDLSVAMGVADATPVGVTVAPDTGDRYVLDEQHGLYRIDADGTAELVMALTDFPVADVLPQSNWTDIAALGDGIFALTALSDGYLLDIERNTLMQHFCYEPGWEEWSSEEQLTTSLGYDAATQSLFAQPRTQLVDMDGATPLGAAVGVYDANLGGDAPESWYELQDDAFLATGLAVESSESLLFVEEDGSIHRFRVGSQPVRLGALRTTVRVEGAALDDDVLLIVDAETDLLLEFLVE